MSLFTATTVEEVIRLINLGHDVNFRNDNDRIPLYSACEKGYLNIVKILCEAGADVNKKSCWFYYPIDMAVKAGHLDIVKYLIENYPVKLDYVLYIVSREGHIDILDYLLTLNLDLNNSHNNPLVIACIYGYIDVVDRLLYAGVNTNIVDQNGYTALRIATSHNRLDIIKKLVMFGADYHTYGGYSLVISCDYSYNKISEFLIDLGCNVNYRVDNMTPLMYACKNNNLKIVKLLLEHGANPNFINDNGKKAIDYCASDEARSLFIKN